MILTFQHKGLAELYETGRSAKIDKRMHRRTIERLDSLDAAASPGDMNIPGYNLHPLLGFKPIRYSVHVNGPWCITFEFEATDALKVDFEQYH